MATDSAFSPDAQPTDADAQRKRKLNALGPSLRSLFHDNDEQQDTADLQTEPLYGGQLSKSAQIEASGAGEPSALSTERVQRAPSMEQTSPLLGPGERFDNLIGEAERGEEG